MGTPDIKDEHVKFIKGVITLVRPKAKACMFGSRAAGSAKAASDLDIVLREDEEIPFSAIADIKELLKASRLPFSVDVVDWRTLSEGFRKAIEKDLKEL